jgi:type IV fimbrial biogenesis protein FimT
MLKSSPVRGITLIELMVTLGIFAMLAMAAAPSIGTWMQNSKVRASAESIMDGLQQARGEAVSRNTWVRFNLTSSLTNGCAVGNNYTNWVINLDPQQDASTVVGLCGTPPKENAQISDPAPRIIGARSASEGSTSSVLVNGSQPTVLFDSLGRSVAAGGSVTFSVTSPTAACTGNGGTVNCLDIIVTPSGRIRMCNPGITASTDPQYCSS